jgi:hypothetical protein
MVVQGSAFFAFCREEVGADRGTALRLFQYWRPGPAKEAEAEATATREIRTKREVFMTGFGLDFEQASRGIL